MSVYFTHFAAEDVPIRNALLRDPEFQANITDFASTVDDDELSASPLRTIAEEHDTKRIFTVRRGQGEVIGLWWITSIDWRSQSCELSFALLPRFRRAFGTHLAEAAFRYLYDELNMKVVISQVMEHNVMLHSTERLTRLRRVRSPYDQFTAGHWVTACYWTSTVEDSRDDVRDLARRRAEHAARLRAALGREGSPNGRNE